MNLRTVHVLLATMFLGACASAPPASTAKAAPRGDPNCLRETGSRIPPKPGHCVMGPGHRYAREDLEGTGASTLTGALRRLHPR